MKKRIRHQIGYGPCWFKARSAAFALLLLATPTLHADVITEWNDVAIPLFRSAPRIIATRQFAIMHVAQFEAVNAVAASAHTAALRHTCFVIVFIMWLRVQREGISCPSDERGVMKQSSTGISRRDFVKTAAATGAAIAIVPRHVLGRGFTPPTRRSAASR